MLRLLHLCLAFDLLEFEFRFRRGFLAGHLLLVNLFLHLHHPGQLVHLLVRFQPLEVQVFLPLFPFSIGLPVPRSPVRHPGLIGIRIPVDVYVLQSHAPGSKRLAKLDEGPVADFIDNLLAANIPAAVLMDDRTEDFCPGLRRNHLFNV